MAKTTLENAVIDFKNVISQLKNITGFSNAELAELIGCSEPTVSRMINDPLSVSGKYILAVQGWLKKKEKERWL